MIICVDVGNTTILFGVYDNEKLIDTFRMETKVLKTSDESFLCNYTYFYNYIFVVLFNIFDFDK